ncbi:MAG TPA: tetraacyldisaccharide 4'-kinase [Bacteroidales bacterium]|jgi:tetraacyldisaccharide 4'-kinase|nr:tetraacyldisaccharide 4'-kinase [Bacteroidales bacterium]
MAFFKHIERPALLPLLPLYGLAVMIRNLFFDLKILRSVKFKIPVISIGNITVGGTGKTPHVEFLAGLLQNDYRIAVLSRGYKRRTDRFIMVKKKSRVVEVGDEPVQIKQKFKDIHVAVNKDRVEGINLLIRNIKKLDLVILDDAFQHRYVKAGLSMLLIDYNKPVFNDVLLPAGNLREPLSGMRRADIILVTKCPSGITPSARTDFISLLKPAALQDVYFTRYEYGPLTEVCAENHDDPCIIPYSQLIKTGVSVMLVTGIANPEPVKRFIEDYARIDEEMYFPDHHYFNDKDIQLMKLKFEAINAKAKYIIVTEKDAVRIREADIRDKKFRRAFYYIPIEVRFLAKGEKPFIKRIYKYMKKASR